VSVHAPTKTSAIPEPKKVGGSALEPIAAQFQGAFNENALNFWSSTSFLRSKDKAQRDQLELLVGVLFAAPSFCFH